MSQNPTNNLPTSQNIHPSALPNAARQQQQQTARFRVPFISPLTQLALDEQSLLQRKINIQRFGATWIKPPGIAKTYQGELDEKAEREEAERQAMMEDVDVVGEEVFDDEDPDNVTRDEVAEEELDLDAEIPDGDGDSFSDDEDDEDLSELEAQEEDEVDLDAEVPEAETEAGWDTSEEDEEDEDDGFDYEDDEEEEEEEMQHTAGIESSPHQAMYSHDERFEPPDSRVEQRLRAYPRRALIRSSDDGMEVDSE